MGSREAEVAAMLMAIAAAAKVEARGNGGSKTQDDGVHVNGGG